MSRVSYVMMNPGRGDAADRGGPRSCVDELIADLCAQVGRGPDRRPGAHRRRQPDHAPPVPGSRSDRAGRARRSRWRPTAPCTAGRRTSNLHTHPGARVYLLPCIAGHVGADTAGVILSEAPYQQETVNLIVDVGTNAEIVLGNRDRMLAASSPTGPAFEGAQISCGQRAAPGAIERVRIDEQTLEPRFTVIGDDRWSDEPAFDASTVTGRVRLGDHRGDRGDVPGRHPDDRRGHRRRARGPDAAGRPRRPHVLLRAARRRAAPGHHAERRAADPAREGGALRRVPAADGPPGHRHRRPHPPGRRVRRAHRSRARAGPGAGAGLRSRTT